MKHPDPEPIIDLIEAFRRSKTMFAAVSLGVFDRLKECPAGLATLASETSTQPQALERLLDGCRGLGLLTKTDGLYANTDLADAFLCRSSPRSMTGYILWSNDMLFRLWTHLEDAVREGSQRWPQAFGSKGPIFSFFADEGAKRTFLMGMHGFGLISSPKVVAAFDLNRFRRLVDLGGATGHLAISACERYPRIAAAVFDLPSVAEVAREQIALSPVKDRIEVLSGDFFEDPLPDADLYALGRILHDWRDGKIDRLLAKIYAKLPRGGALLIAEKLLDEDKGGPVPAHMQSLNMLVVTEGRERTLSEYGDLLRKAGFSSVEGQRTGAPLDAVLAVK